jgi:hypothetical protein
MARMRSRRRWPSSVLRALPAAAARWLRRKKTRRHRRCDYKPEVINIFFEGTVNANPTAQYGQQKGTDCPLMTLGLVLDASAFSERRSRGEGACAPPPPGVDQ